MTAREHHEAFTQLPVYCTLVKYLRPGVEPLDETTCPGDLVGVMAQHSIVQLGCLIIAHCPWITDDIDEAAEYVGQVYEKAQANKRPRYLAEMGAHVADGGESDGC